MPEAQFYDYNLAPLKFWGIDKYGHPKRVALAISGGRYTYTQDDDSFV